MNYFMQLADKLSAIQYKVSANGVFLHEDEG